MSFLAIDNPVMWAELKHQRHIIRSSRSGWFWIVLALVMLVPAFLASVVIVAGAFLGVNLEAVFSTPPLNILAEVGVSSLMIMHFALYAVVTLVTLALAARSINREHEGHTWESLLLTDVTARQIVQGKWWATLRALWGDHLMVLIVRLGFLAWLDYLASAPDLPQPPRLAVGLLVMTAFTLADSALTVVIGILPAVSGRNPIVLTLAIGLRFAVSIGINALVFAVGLLVHEWNPYLVGAVIAAMGAYVLVIAGMLRFTEWAAVRNRVSPARAVPA